MPAAILLCCGIVASRAAALSLSAWIFALIPGLLLYLHRKTRTPALAWLFFAGGAALYSGRYEILSADDLRLAPGDKPALATIRGKLEETPSLRDFYYRSNKVETAYARVAVTEIQLDGTWHPARGVVAASTRGNPGDGFFKGRTVEISGVISRPPAAAAPGLFDYRQFLYNSRVFYQFRADAPSDWHLLSFERLPVTEWFLRWAKTQLARGVPQDDALQMIWSMTLADKQAMNSEWSGIFMRTGTIHIFAISGLHVACIAGVLLGAGMKLFAASRARCSAFVIAAIWFYTLATGLQSSAIRSALMCTVAAAAWVLRRPVDLINCIAASALIILLLQPEQLFQTSFQLSFCVVLSIALTLEFVDSLNPKLPIHFRVRVFGRDGFLPRELRPKWQQWVDRLAAPVYGSLLVSLASWIGSIPVCAYYFNLVAPVTILANLLAVPLSSIALAANVWSLAIPPLGPVFNYASWRAMQATIAWAKFCDRPWVRWHVPRPNAWIFFLWFSVMLIVLVPALRRGKTKRLSVSLGAFFLLMSSLSWLRARQHTTITMLAIPGNPLYIDAPGRENDCLIDCSSARDAEFTTARFLHGSGIGTLAHLLLTHLDSSHSGGLARMLEDFAPAAVGINTTRLSSRAYKQAKLALSSSRAPPLELRHGSAFAGWTALQAVAPAGRSRGSDSALALKSEISGWKILHLSDLSSRGQRALLENGEDLNAHVLLASPAPGETSLSDELIAAVNPSLIVLGISDAPFRRHRAIPPRSIHGIPVLCAHDAAAVTLELTKTALRASSVEGLNFYLEH